ncbi:hypothetical protein BHE74_00023206 [Ensete ventricosum]|nr:hypothetical protein BHE74_00023206 [Ensete ventricosum]
MAYSRITVGVGDPSLSSSASGVFIQYDGGQTPATARSMSEKGNAGLRPASGDMNQILNSTGNSSGPSVGASSFVTDANSALSGGSQLQRSPSFNNESYMRLPSSPISFSSNVSGSSVMDGCSNVQQSPLQGRVQKQGLLTATSQLMQQEPSNLMNARKKPRLDITKKRWCLSLYDNMGSHAPGVLPQLAMNDWQCNICGTKSVKGFG